MADRQPPRRRITLLVVIGLLALVLDIASKIIVVEHLSDRHPIRLLGGLLTLRVTRNSGAAFSIGTGATLLFTVIAAVVIIAILRTARNLRSLPWAIALGLLLGGAMGNLIDRLLRSPSPLQGHVVDWIELPHWPVFNVADSAIVCGGILAVVLAARGYQLDGGRVPAQDEGKSKSKSKSQGQGQGASKGQGASEGTAQGSAAGRTEDHDRGKAGDEHGGRAAAGPVHDSAARPPAASSDEESAK